LHAVIFDQARQEIRQQDAPRDWQPKGDSSPLPTAIRLTTKIGTSRTRYYVIALLLIRIQSGTSFKNLKVFSDQPAAFVPEGRGAARSAGVLSVEIARSGSLHRAEIGNEKIA
jgi:hypothetical protein